ncbi:hypothetical protein [Pseudonocardia sp.]|uniref:hypothetical protein n=1 Tax=Pseudonocardia sp. TaxID=60912 RepID=UPI003D100AAA
MLIVAVELSVLVGTLVVMARLGSVPEWVDPPLRAVADSELYLLTVFKRTRAPQALGSWVCLSWLGAEDGERTPGPLGEGLPTETAAWASMLVADAIAEDAPYPVSGWWAVRGIAPADRITPDGWAARVGSGYTRRYMHGVTVALGWLLGELSDPRLMAPVFDGAGERIPVAEREVCQARLWALSERARTSIAG